MKVRVTTDLGGVHVAGSVMDVPDATAKYLIEQGQAAPLDEVRASEVAPPRNTAARTKKPQPRRAV